MEKESEPKLYLGYDVRWAKESLNKDIEKGLDRLIKEAYKEGFAEGCKEEWLNPMQRWHDKVLRESRYLALFNYRAIGYGYPEDDWFVGGFSLNWYKATHHPVYQVISKAYLEAMFQDMVVVAVRDCEFNDRLHNARLIFRDEDSVFRNDFCIASTSSCWDEQGHMADLYPEAKDNPNLFYAQIWLADEVDRQHALCAIIPMKFEEGKATGEILPTIYKTVPKEYSMPVHYCYDYKDEFKLKKHF